MTGSAMSAHSSLGLRFERVTVEIADAVFCFMNGVSPQVEGLPTQTSGTEDPVIMPC